MLALSTMMSTTLENMRLTIERCRRECPEVKIAVGGAPMDRIVAKQVGADVYATTAARLPDVIDELLPATTDSKEGRRAYTDFDRRIKVTEVRMATGDDKRGRV